MAPACLMNGCRSERSSPPRRLTQTACDLPSPNSFTVGGFAYQKRLDASSMVARKDARFPTHHRNQTAWRPLYLLPGRTSPDSLPIHEMKAQTSFSRGPLCCTYTREISCAGLGGHLRCQGIDLLHACPVADRCPWLLPDRWGLTGRGALISIPVSAAAPLFSFGAKVDDAAGLPAGWSPHYHACP